MNDNDLVTVPDSVQRACLTEREIPSLIGILQRREGEILLNPRDFIAVRGTGGVSLLHIAVMQGNKKVLEAFLGAGMDVDTQSDYGVTPLMVAATLHNETIGDILLAHGADETRTNCVGLSVAGYYAFGGVQRSDGE
jgi:ankyrin repeat protein